MTPTMRQLNRATLDRQLLLERQRLDPVEAVRRIVAVQAQEPPSPYLALWNRVEGFDAVELDAAFAERSIVKASLMRITLHAVVAGEYASFHEAMSPSLRAARLNDRRFRETGLTVEGADELIPELVAFADEPRSKDEIVDHLTARLGEPPHQNVWWALRTFAPLVHSPVEPPWSFGRRPWFEAAPEPGVRPAESDALRYLIRRFLAGFGPATVADVAQFTLLKRSVVWLAVDDLGDELTVLDGPGGERWFDVADGPGLPDPDRPAPPRLMPMWDSTLLAYADRSRILPEEYRSHVIRRNGDVLPTVLVDGVVAGVWRPVDAGIEITVFESVADEWWDQLDVEASALRGFLADRDPEVYRRYGRWWDQLPITDRRVLAT